MGAMCRGDVSVITHRWKEGSIKPNVEQRAPHQCVDWDAVTGFAAERTVDIWQEGYIRNPNTGQFPFSYFFCPFFLLFTSPSLLVFFPSVPWQMKGSREGRAVAVLLT